MSNLLVQNIKHTNGTTAQTIDSSGRTRLEGNPCFGVRGVASSSSSDISTGNRSTYREITGWSTTDVDRGGMIVNGRMQAPVTGVYQFFVSSAATPSFTAQNRLVEAYKVVSGSFTILHEVWSANDYGRYFLGFQHIISLNAGEQISVGFADGYGWHTPDAYTSFSGMLLG